MALHRERSAKLPGFGSDPCEVQLTDAVEQELSSNWDVAADTAEEDELRYSAAMDRVQAVAEQVEEFLARFSPQERRAIQAPFLLRPNASKTQPPSLPPTAPTSPVGFRGDQLSLESQILDGTGDSVGPAVEPHIDEARRFICTYLAMYPENEQCLALARIGISTRPGLNRSSSSAEFLNMRRKVRLSPIRKLVRANTATRELLRLKALKSDTLLRRPPSGRQPLIQRVIETFQCHDVDGTGTIDREHLTCVLKMLNPVLVEHDLDSFLERRWCGDSIDYAAFAAWVFQEKAAMGG